MLYETMDIVFYPWEIDAILDAAITLCPAMKRHNKKMYPANAMRAVPDVCCGDDERAFLVAVLLNDLVELC